MVEREAIARLRSHAEMLDSAAMPTKSEVFVLCGPEAGQMRDDLNLILALLSPSTLLAEGVEGNAWDWLAEQTNLTLDYEYGELEDDDGQWEVLRVSGGVNDREWEFLASGKTPLEAVQAARAALSPTQVGGLGTGSACTDSAGEEPDGSFASDSSRKSDELSAAKSRLSKCAERSSDGNAHVGLAAAYGNYPHPSRTFAGDLRAILAAVAKPTGEA